MTSEFTERVINIIKSIPEGKVLTYGRVAALAGNPKGARQVVRILHSCSRKYDLPWHRVVNSKGRIAFREQKQLLEKESVTFKKEDTVDLNHALWYI